MIVDTSALVAFLRREPEAERIGVIMRRASSLRLSAASYLELAAVIDGPRDAVASGSLDEMLRLFHIEMAPFTAAQARIARGAYRDFGKGSGHPARLNMGDCFSYALARDTGEPLLFKGRDFSHTDIEMVTEPIKGRRLSEVMASYDTGAS